MSNNRNRDGRGRGSWLRRLLVLGLLGAVFAVAYTQFGEYLSLAKLAEHEAAFREFQRSHPVLVYGAAFGIYVAITALSLPGALAMTLLTGWLFGFWRAVLLVSFASTTGATLAFLLSRYLFRETIQRKFGDRLQRFNQALQREGAFYLFTLRLIPAVPFFVINVVMSLTPMRTWTFWWVSQVGMLPGTAVYVYAGANVPTLQELARRGVGSILSTELMIAFILLGLFPLVTKKLLGRWLRSSAVPSTDDRDEQTDSAPHNSRPRHRSTSLFARRSAKGSHEHDPTTNDSGR